MEIYRCAVVVATLTDNCYGSLGVAAAVLLHVDFASAAHFGAKVGGKGVYARYTHTVQTARHLVGAFVELTAGMQHCEHHFEGTFV